MAKATVGAVAAAIAAAGKRGGGGSAATTAKTTAKQASSSGVKAEPAARIRPLNRGNILHYRCPLSVEFLHLEPEQRQRAHQRAIEGVINKAEAQWKNEDVEFQFEKLDRLFLKPSSRFRTDRAHQKLKRNSAGVYLLVKEAMREKKLEEQRRQQPSKPPWFLADDPVMERAFNQGMHKVNWQDPITVQRNKERARYEDWGNPLRKD